MPLTITDRITNDLNPSESSKDLDKNYILMSWTFINNIINRLKILLLILGGFGKSRVKFKFIFIERKTE